MDDDRERHGFLGKSAPPLQAELRLSNTHVFDFEASQTEAAGDGHLAQFNT